MLYWVGLQTEAGDLQWPGYARRTIDVPVDDQPHNYSFEWRLQGQVPPGVIQFAALYTSADGNEVQGWAKIGGEMFEHPALEDKSVISLVWTICIPRSRPPDDDKEPEPVSPPPRGETVRQN